MIGPKTDRFPIEFTDARKKLIRETRAKERCEGCGRYVETQVHHRLYKSRGGRGTVANGMALCGLGNASGCHGKAHSKEGEDLGWSLPSGSNPLGSPVRLWRFGWVGLAYQQWAMFDDQGRVVWITDEDAQRRMKEVA